MGYSPCDHRSRTRLSKEQERERAHAGSAQDDFLRREWIQICVLCSFLSPTFPKKGARAPYVYKDAIKDNLSSCLTSAFTTSVNSLKGLFDVFRAGWR